MPNRKRDLIHQVFKPRDLILTLQPLDRFLRVEVWVKRADLSDDRFVDRPRPIREAHAMLVVHEKDLIYLLEFPPFFDEFDPEFPILKPNHLFRVPSDLFPRRSPEHRANRKIVIEQ